MGQGYTRNDTTNNIADGNVINASDLDGEFDAVEAAFNASTGHTHDGTAAEGAPITVVGPAQEWIVDGTALYPKTDNTYDIGKAGAEVKDLYVDGTANIDSLVADTADINGGTFDGVVGGTTPAAGTFSSLVATTADINAGTFDGVVGGTTPAAGSFTTLSATGNITLSGDIVTDIVIAEASPSITMTDTDTSTDAIISTDNAGSIRIRADNGNAAASSEISFEVDGTVVGTWDASELTVSDTAPTIVLNDTNGTSTNAQMAIRMTGSSVAFTSRDNTGSSVGYDDILIGRSTAGATIYQFNILGTTTLEVDSGGVTVVGDIVGDSDIMVDGDGSYFTAQTATATGATGYTLRDNNGVARSDLVWVGNDLKSYLRAYNAFGSLQHTYNLTDANFNITDATALNNGFNISIDGTRRVTIDADSLKTYATDGTTQVGNFPLVGTQALAATSAWSLQSGTTANLAVDSAGLIRRITSTGEFKINREEISGTGPIVDSLTPVSFESTHEADNGRRFTGFIAEEVAAAYPEASVDEGQNYDVRALVAILWQEVKDLRQRVAQLEAN